MTEGLSLAGMAELPIVIILGQRPGPSTGLPTYTAQTELNFALHAGQGEFLRFIVAPGDAEEAYYWSGVAMNLSWKYQIPSIILTDKHLGESVFSFDVMSAGNAQTEKISMHAGNKPFKRYLVTEDGISPMAFVPSKGNVIKINSYEHDESGITTEDPEITRLMQEKRLRKEGPLQAEINSMEAVKIYGDLKSEIALVCWGSNKGVCVECAEKLGIRVIQPMVINPFPVARFGMALKGTKRLISVENNATAQLTGYIESFGFAIDETVLKYDGRPFSCDELEERLERAMK
jgi:2-oxoglutarate ferredoxin oxidoreductase subunit alpha